MSSTKRVPSSVTFVDEELYDLLKRCIRYWMKQKGLSPSEEVFYTIMDAKNTLLSEISNVWFKDEIISEIKQNGKV